MFVGDVLMGWYACVIWTDIECIVDVALFELNSAVCYDGNDVGEFPVQSLLWTVWFRMLVMIKNHIVEWLYVWCWLGCIECLLVMMNHVQC